MSEPSPVDPPALSVVLAAVNEPALLAHALDALAAQTVPMEVLVVRRPGDGAVETACAGRGPGVKGVEAPPGVATIPALRALGIDRARAPWVAVIEDHTDVVPGWAEALLAGHAGGADVVGGPVVNGCDGVVDRAQLLIEYAGHAPPLPDDPAAGVAGNNLSYSRTALAAAAPLREVGLWEPFTLAHLAACGLRLERRQDAGVLHRKPFTFSHHASQRWHGSRSYGAMRMQGEPLPLRLAIAATTPLVVPLLAARIAREVLRRRSPALARRWLRCLPWTLVFLTIGAAGEAAGALLGDGGSTARVV